MRKQEQVLVLFTREMRKAEARPHDSWHELIKDIVGLHRVCGVSTEHCL